MPCAHIHAIGAVVPGQDIHAAFVDWALARLGGREQALFRRMASRSGIEHRWSILPPTEDGGSPVCPGGFYAGGTMPATAARMALYAAAAPDLAVAAVSKLAEKTPVDGITHLIVASCTGFVAPGVDQIIASRLGLSPDIERTLVGFMGCYAAVAALRVAHHIARSAPQARILVVTVELSTLHLQSSAAIEPLLAMLQFADGAAAALVSAAPAGLAIEQFFAATLPGTEDLIRWTIGDTGFAMHLSGEVPARIGHALADPAMRSRIFRPGDESGAWAIHAGGRSILDAVQTAFALPDQALQASRGVLRRFGNMSSSTLMFVLADIMAGDPVDRGVALAFGPGLAAEGFRIRSAA